MTGVVHFHSVGQLCADNAPASWALVSLIFQRAYLVKKNRMFWYISKCCFSLSPCQMHKGFFSSIYCENLVELLEVNQIVGSSPMTWPMVFLPLRFVFTGPPAILQLQFRYSYTEQISALVSCDSLYLLVCLSDLVGSGLPCVFCSFMDLRRI